MAEQILKPTSNRQIVYAFILIVMAVACLIWPDHALNTAMFVIQGLITVAPIVVPGILLTAWIISSGADSRIASAFDGKTGRTILAASLIGAVTPVCGVTVLPMMVGLLAAGVPLAPIMAFWLSSPVTDPAMLATTAATLGLSFAIGKTTAAFFLGLLGGSATAIFMQRPWAKNALRDNNLVHELGTKRCESSCAGPQTFNAYVWKSASAREAFGRQFRATTKLMLICLTPAFAAEYALNAALTPNALATYVGEDQWWAIPAAVFVGAPAYIDGYAALPLTRGLIDGGMSEGAAMAFLVSGGVVSIWGAMAIAPVLKPKPFMLYLALAIMGSLMAGYAFQWVV